MLSVSECVCVCVQQQRRWAAWGQPALGRMGLHGCMASGTGPDEAAGAGPDGASWRRATCAFSSGAPAASLSLSSSSSERYCVSLRSTHTVLEAEGYSHGTRRVLGGYSAGAPTGTGEVPLHGVLAG